MDKSIDEVDLNNVMHVRAHPIGFKNDRSYYYFEVHFTSVGKGPACPSPWELRAFSLVRDFIKSHWVQLILMDVCFRRNELHGSLLFRQMLPTAQSEVHTAS